MDYAQVKVLDHGYVRPVEKWGSDEAVIEAARMSTQKGFEGWGPIHASSCSSVARSPHGTSCDCVPSKGDEKLLAYLWKNKHHTPFEMAGLTVEVQAPIFVFREWHRHRVPFSYNEASARYAPLPDINYVPTVDRLLLGGGHLTKQAGSTGGVLDKFGAELFRSSLEKAYQAAQTLYENALADGVPKELARVVLPVGRYSRMRASSNLRGWLNFLALRAEPHAQWEIQQYAWTVHGMLSREFPRTLALFDEGRPPR